MIVRGRAMGAVVSTLALLWCSCGSPASRLPSTPLPAVPRPALDRLDDDQRAALTAQRQALDRVIESVDAVAGSDAGDDRLAEAYGETGRLYLAHAFPEAAEVCFAYAAELAPRNFAWWYLGAVAGQRHGDFDEAARRLDRALAIEANAVPAVLRRGRLAWERQRPVEAARFYRRALELDADAAVAHFGLGLVAPSSAAAIEHFTAALAAQPAANAIHHPLALAYRDLGDVERARHHLARAGSRRPSFPDPLIDELGALVSSARIHIVQASRDRRDGDPVGARAHLERAIVLDPSSARAHHNLGALLGELGRPAEAIVLLERAVALAPEDPDPLMDLGTAFAASGRLADSLAAFERVLVLTPDDREARFRRDRVGVAMGARRP